MNYNKILLKIFLSLIKAHGVEVRLVVRQALEIVTPAILTRVEDGYKMLTHWTKKIIVEEGHAMPQLFHILQLIVRHYNVYYPVRHHLVWHMVNSLQRLGFSASSTMEHKKLAVELAEVIIRWELRRIKEESQLSQVNAVEIGQKRSMPDEGEQSRKRGIAAVKHDLDENKPIDRLHANTILNFLARLACQVNELNPPTTGAGTSPGEILSQKCLTLIRKALIPDVLPHLCVDLRLLWMDKVFSPADNRDPNLGNICIGLELLTFLLTVMKKEQILLTCKSLQEGLNACISSSNDKVLLLTHKFLMKLMSVFPSEACSPNTSSNDVELESIYSSIGRVINEGLANYEKNVDAKSSSLFVTIMMLKAACANNPSYVDRIINHFVRVILRMTREHLSAPTQPNPGSVELLIMSLDLVKTRVGVMTGDTKNIFICSILMVLIEKTKDVKLMEAVCTILEEWMKSPKILLGSLTSIACGPSLKEKTALLVTLMHNIEKRFPSLHNKFLELVNCIYRVPRYQNTKLVAKLMPAFLAGLRCSNHQIRAKFFEIFDSSIKRKLYDRLMFIVCTQNWEPMGCHYWINQCIEFILVCTDQGSLMEQSGDTPSLQGIMGVLISAEPYKRGEFLKYSNVKSDISDVDNPNFMEDEVPDLRQIMMEYMHMTQLKMKTFNFLCSVSQLCYIDSTLSERIWLDLFPRIWKLLVPRERANFSAELLPLLVSMTQLSQKDITPSPTSTMFEALLLCQPPVDVKPQVMSFLGKNQNLWHRVTLGLEDLVAKQSSVTLKNVCDFELFDDLFPNQDALENLAEMYTHLKEEDMWVTLWSKHAQYKETRTALVYQQQGLFEKALDSYELALVGKVNENSTNSVARFSRAKEEALWEKEWIDCSKELNQWDHLLGYSHSKGNSNPFLILESAWRIPDWDMVKEALDTIERFHSKEMTWEVLLYRGFLAVCSPQNQKASVIECVESARSYCIKNWKKLPPVVTQMHVPHLQAAQQIIELQEAYQICVGLSGQKNLDFEIKTLIKTWRNRLPIITDDLSYWNNIFTWRQRHYQNVSEQKSALIDPGISNSLYGVNTCVQAVIFGKIARKHRLPDVSLQSLSGVYSVKPNCLSATVFQKLKQQIKCYFQKVPEYGYGDLIEGLKTVEATDVNSFSKECSSELNSIKGMILSRLGQSADANKAYSNAVQSHNTMVKGWASWGEYIEEEFTKSSYSDIQLGVAAMVCFLRASRQQHESKARKYLAKVLWLLTFEDKENQMISALEKYISGVPPVHWLPWIPQLLTCLTRTEGDVIMNLLIQIIRICPQAVYFPLKTLYFTLKMEQTFKMTESSSQLAGKSNSGPKTADQAQGGSQEVPDKIAITPAILRCTQILYIQKDINPTVFFFLEGLLEEMKWFRENWYEEVLRQLHQGLLKCYHLAFENQGAVSDAIITPNTFQFIRKVISTFFNTVFDKLAGRSSSVVVNNSLSENVSESVDPAFQKMKNQLTADLSSPGTMKVQKLIYELKKWIKFLEARIKLLPKSFLIEEKSRFLNNFNSQTIEMEMPGEFLSPKHSHYVVKISRFMPKVEIVRKYNTSARRLYIRGHNGKIYPYLVLNDSGYGDSRREEHVSQLFRMINNYFTKNKETGRRLVQITVPKVVAMNSYMRLVEDNPTSLSLLDIFKTVCSVKEMDHDAPIIEYYEKLATIQARGMNSTLQNLRNILKEVQKTKVSPSLLKDWAVKTYLSASDYWSFRKTVTVHMSTLCFCEYVFYMTRLNPDMLYVHQDSGSLHVGFFKFDLNNINDEADMNCPVPFRLTPNIRELLTETGISGPFNACIVSSARCLNYQSHKVASILKAVLRDEMICAYKKKQEDSLPPQTVLKGNRDGDQIVKMVMSAVNLIMSRLNSLTSFEDPESKVYSLISAAQDPDNLCRMDPAWHPWL